MMKFDRFKPMESLFSIDREDEDGSVMLDSVPIDSQLLRRNILI
jgi:hypothetical protein